MLGGPDTPPGGLRARKKQRTRWALTDAALQLFLTKGYETTTIDEIVAAVDVSQRTFFRYFATKEDVALSLLTHYDELFVAALRARPAGAAPVAALSAALGIALDAVEESGPEDAARFRAVQRLVEHTPALTAGRLRRSAELERTVVEIIAARGDAGADDLGARLIVASFMTAVRVAYEGCAQEGELEPATVARRIRTVLARAAGTLPAAWSAGAGAVTASARPAGPERAER